MKAILVCGGRDYTDASCVNRTLNNFHEEHKIGLVIQGGANGADKLAKLWAERHAVHCCEVPALWTVHGVAAGPKRNAAMLLLKPDRVIAFPGGAGTANMVRQALKLGVAVDEILGAVS